MRAVFLGTPATAVPALAALTSVADVDLVVTRPDAPRGRSGAPQPPAVKLAAREWGFTVAQPSTARELHELFRDRDVDLGVVVAYGRILSPEVLAGTRFGFVNLHFSLLPRWRGAAPVERAILAGDDLTGVSLMVLDEGLDTGPVLAVRETEILGRETAGEVTARMAVLGAELLAATLPEYLSGARRPAPQLATGVTIAQRILPAEARLSLEDDPVAAVRKVRAYNPRPGAWVETGGGRLKIWSASVAEYAVVPGRIEGRDGRPHLGLDEGAIALEEVQPAGKRRMSGAAWWRGTQGGPLEIAEAR